MPDAIYSPGEQAKPDYFRPFVRHRVEALYDVVKQEGHQAVCERCCPGCCYHAVVGYHKEVDNKREQRSSKCTRGKVPGLLFNVRAGREVIVPSLEKVGQ